MASSVECELCLAQEVVPTAAEYAPGKLDSSKRNCLVLQGRACEAQKTFVEKQIYHMGKDTYQSVGYDGPALTGQVLQPHGEKDSVQSGGGMQRLSVGQKENVPWNLRLRQELEHIPLGLGGPYSPWVLCGVLLCHQGGVSPVPAKMV